MSKHVSAQVRYLRRTVSKQGNMHARMYISLYFYGVFSELCAIEISRAVDMVRSTPLVVHYDPSIAISRVYLKCIFLLHSNNVKVQLVCN